MMWSVVLLSCRVKIKNKTNDRGKCARICRIELKHKSGGEPNISRDEDREKNAVATLMDARENAAIWGGGNNHRHAARSRSQNLSH